MKEYRVSEGVYEYKVCTEWLSEYRVTEWVQSEGVGGSRYIHLYTFCCQSVSWVNWKWTTTTTITTTTSTTTYTSHMSVNLAKCSTSSSSILQSVLLVLVMFKI